MTPTKNTRIAAVAGVAVALVAAGGAYAASKIRHGSPTAAAVSGSTFVAAGRTGATPANGFGFRGGPRAGGDDLAAAADYLGTTTQDLLTQLQSGKTLAQIADATSGKSSSGLIDALVAAEQKEHPDASASDIRARETAFVNGTGGPGFRHGPGDALAAAATYLGTTTQDLLTQLQSGKTLAQIADATSGKSSSGLIDALVAAEQKEHPDANASDIRTHVTALVNGTGFPFHGPPPGTAPPGREQQGTHI
jgi:hypothetical protein